jgi:acylphosphatase
MDTPVTITRLLRITGRVQGVYYRASTVQQAQALGLRGWVRNRRDGSVEALATGPAEAVQALIEWAQRGPVMARVERVEVQEVLGAAQVLDGFEQRETV